MLRVGIVWATGAVGRELIPLLKKRDIEIDELRLFGSERSAGKIIETPYWNIPVQILQDETITWLDVLFFAAGGDVSKEWCPKASEKGIICIDKSSVFRMTPEVPLVVPEVNSGDLIGHTLIANPNCTTSIAAVVLAPLHREFGLKKIIMSTYQAASGAGQPAMEELKLSTQASLAGESFTPQEFAYNLAFNLIPQIDSFVSNNYTKEEMKVTDELKKILHLPDSVLIECTAVRIPILRAHSESITLETEKPFDVAKARQILTEAPGVQVLDNPIEKLYPMPSTVEGKDDVQVGRIRQSIAFGNYGGTLFVSWDQLLKWAALNAVQILEEILRQKNS